MSGSTTTKKTTPTESEVNVTRTIAAEDEIWEPDSEEKERFLSLDEQMGAVSLELSKPLPLSDRDEDATHLEIQAPTMENISKTQGNIRQLIEKCIVGINPRDLSGLHGRDYIRLQLVVRHFLV